MSDKPQRLTTAIGTAIYPSLVDADYKFDTAGKYKVSLRLPADSQVYDTKRQPLGLLTDFLDEQIKQAHAEAQRQSPKKRVKVGNPPYEVDMETGEVILKVSMKASGVTRSTGKPFTQRPALFDAKGKPFAGAEIWSGTRMKVTFDLNPYNNPTNGASVTCRLKAVQIIELRDSTNSSRSADADSYGFEEEEGYEYTEQPAQGYEGAYADEEEAVPFDDGDGDF